MVKHFINLLLEEQILAEFFAGRTEACFFCRLLSLRMEAKAMVSKDDICNNGYLHSVTVSNKLILQYLQCVLFFLIMYHKFSVS